MALVIPKLDGCNFYINSEKCACISIENLDRRIYTQHVRCHSRYIHPRLHIKPLKHQPLQNLNSTQLGKPKVTNKTPYSYTKLCMTNLNQYNESELTQLTRLVNSDDKKVVSYYSTTHIQQSKPDTTRPTQLTESTRKTTSLHLKK